MKEKLVRDNIPKIIEKSSGVKPKTRVLGEREYKLALDNKLQEEVSEYLQGGNPEELADIQEVVLAIAKARGVSRKKLEKIRTKKAKKNGRFKKRISLVSY
jgi:predicted house-cleaning noncanonical NTP pyrophosphatase (MazG superfamily)